MSQDLEDSLTQHVGHNEAEIEKSKAQGCIFSPLERRQSIYNISYKRMDSQLYVLHFHDTPHWEEDLEGM